MSDFTENYFRGVAFAYESGQHRTASRGVAGMTAASRWSRPYYHFLESSEISCQNPSETSRESLVRTPSISTLCPQVGHLICDVSFLFLSISDTARYQVPHGHFQIFVL